MQALPPALIDSRFWQRRALDAQAELTNCRACFGCQCLQPRLRAGYGEPDPYGCTDSHHRSRFRISARGRGPPLMPIGECAAGVSRRRLVPISSGEVEAIEVHHLGPCRDEVLHELLLRIVARIDFRERAEL